MSQLKKRLSGLCELVWLCACKDNTPKQWYINIILLVENKATEATEP